MTKEEKLVVINAIAEQLQAYPHFYIADIEALNAEQTAALRRKCYESDIKLVVVKNTLLAKALEKVEKADAELVKVLEGPTSIMFAKGAFTWATISWTLCATSSRRKSLSAISLPCSSPRRRMLFLHCRLMQAKRLRAS